MKSNIKKIWIVLLFCTSLPCFAQSQGGGNGGIGIVCRNWAGKVKSARLLDIVEGKERDNYTYDHYSKADVSLIAGERLGGALNAKHIKSQVESIRLNAHFTSTPFSLPDPKDFNPRVGIKKRFGLNCNFETIALFDDITKKLTIDEEIFKELSSFEQQALYWHEYIYKNARAFSHTKFSDRSRKTVGWLLSVDGQVKDISIVGDFEAGVLKRECHLGSNGYLGSVKSITINGVKSASNTFELPYSQSDTNVAADGITFSFRQYYNSFFDSGYTDYINISISVDTKNFRYDHLTVSGILQLNMKDPQSSYLSPRLDTGNEIKIYCYYTSG